MLRTLSGRMAKKSVKNSAIGRKVVPQVLEACFFGLFAMKTVSKQLIDFDNIFFNSNHLDRKSSGLYIQINWFPWVECPAATGRSQ